MDSKKVTHIIFCFENLEQISIPVEDVEAYFFDGVHYNIMGIHSDLPMKMQVCNEALIMLKPHSNESASSSFDMDNDKYPRINLFHRLSIFSDCVGIDLLYEDETREEIYVPWENRGDKEDENNCQMTFQHNNEELRGIGCLCVHFGRTKELLEGFGLS